MSVIEREHRGSEYDPRNDVYARVGPISAYSFYMYAETTKKMLKTASSPRGCNPFASLELGAVWLSLKLASRGFKPDDFEKNLRSTGESCASFQYLTAPLLQEELARLGDARYPGNSAAASRMNYFYLLPAQKCLQKDVGDPDRGPPTLEYIHSIMIDRSVDGLDFSVQAILADAFIGAGNSGVSLSATSLETARDIHSRLDLLPINKYQ